MSFQGQQQQFNNNNNNGNNQLLGGQKNIPQMAKSPRVGSRRFFSEDRGFGSQQRLNGPIRSILKKNVSGTSNSSVSPDSIRRANPINRPTCNNNQHQSTSQTLNLSNQNQRNNQNPNYHRSSMNSSPNKYQSNIPTTQLSYSQNTNRPSRQAGKISANVSISSSTGPMSLNGGGPLVMGPGGRTGRMVKHQ